MTIEDLKEEICNNLQNVDYEERSNYGIIDAVYDAFTKYETVNKTDDIHDVVESFSCENEQKGSYKCESQCLGCAGLEEK